MKLATLLIPVLFLATAVEAVARYTFTTLASLKTEVENPVACPPQWLPVILASTPWPPTHRRRLLNYKFTSRADLKTATQEYNANSLAATSKYGPVANWDVSDISDMRELFKGRESFNADISSWDTSVVTDMSQMFRVRSTPALPSTSAVGPTPCTLRTSNVLHNHELHVHRALAVPHMCSRALPYTLLAPRSPLPPACRPVYLAPHRIPSL